MAVDENNKELSREWKRLIRIAGNMGHGTIELTVVDGKPTMVKRAVQGIKLDEPGNGDEEKYRTIFL